MSYISVSKTHPIWLTQPGVRTLSLTIFYQVDFVPSILCLIPSSPLKFSGIRASLLYAYFFNTTRATYSSLYT